MTKTDIANMALSLIGQSDRISDFTDDESVTASTVRLHYEDALRRILGDYDWNFARKRDALALVADDPNINWAFAYKLPTDCVSFRKIASSAPADTQDNRIPFDIGQDANGGLIFSNESEAEGIYTFFMQNTALMPPAFIDALAYLLASKIAPSITSGDAAGLGDKCYKKYLFDVREAQVADAIQQMPEQPADSPSILAR